MYASVGREVVVSEWLGLANSTVLSKSANHCPLMGINTSMWSICGWNYIFQGRYWSKVKRTCLDTKVKAGFRRLSCLLPRKVFNGKQLEIIGLGNNTEAVLIIGTLRGPINYQSQNLFHRHLVFSNSKCIMLDGENNPSYGMGTKMPVNAHGLISGTTDRKPLPP